MNQTRAFLKLANFAPAVLIGLAAVAAANPTLSIGVWQNITPPGNTGAVAGVITMAIDPSNRSTLYACIQDNGLWRTTDGGSNWALMGDPNAAPQNGTTKYLDVPFNVAVDPADSKHIYATDAVRGRSIGFWVSTDGGNNWYNPPGWLAIASSTTTDMSQMAVDPTDFNHLILSSHNYWGGANAAGIVESKDGGQAWIVHQPPAGLSFAGTPGIAFLYDPAHGVTDTKTWIYVGEGIWRTSDAGASWSEVAAGATGPHGYDQIYRAGNGALYAGGFNFPWRSTDNGLTWQQLSNNGIPNALVYAICGDGTNMYTMIDPNNGSPNPWLTSPESDGLTWKSYLVNGTTQTSTRGPISSKYDSVNRIMYAACWQSGLWAMKTNDPNTGIVLANASPNPASVVDNATTSVTFTIDATAQSPISAITIDLTPVGGNANVTMTKTTGNTYAATFAIHSGVLSGSKSLQVMVTDNSSHSFYGTIILSVIDHTAPVLISRNKAVTVSSAQDATVPGSNVVDGDLSTRWSSNTSDPQWICIDLGEAMLVDQVILHWESAYGRSYQIQVSTDATNWTTAFTTTTGNGGVDSISFASVSARYVRMYGTQRGTTYGYSLYEFEVYSPPNGTTPTTAIKLSGSATKPSVSVAKRNVVVAVGPTTVWRLSIFALTGTKIAEYAGTGPRMIPLMERQSITGESVIVRLTSEEACRNAILVVR